MYNSAESLPFQCYILKCSHNSQQTHFSKKMISRFKQFLHPIASPSLCYTPFSTCHHILLCNYLLAPISVTPTLQVITTMNNVSQTYVLQNGIAKYFTRQYNMLYSIYFYQNQLIANT